VGGPCISIGNLMSIVCVKCRNERRGAWRPRHPSVHGTITAGAEAEAKAIPVRRCWV